MVDEVMQEFGRIDVLVNNAATTAFVSFDDIDGMTEEDWDRIMDTNAKGPFLCCKAVVPIMRKQGGGRIISIGTTSAARPAGSSVMYSAAKAALTHMSTCLAKGLAPVINVNIVAAGPMPTRWFSHISGETMTEERKQRTIDSTALKRYAALEDVAAAAVMVAKNDSMTGEIVKVDAGYCLVN
jgi:3-oxoacyl-[acyl-carrier protein] reductase